MLTFLLLFFSVSAAEMACIRAIISKRKTDLDHSSNGHRPGRGSGSSDAASKPEKSPIVFVTDCETQQPLKAHSASAASPSDSIPSHKSSPMSNVASQVKTGRQMNPPMTLASAKPAVEGNLSSENLLSEGTHSESPYFSMNAVAAFDDNNSASFMPRASLETSSTACAVSQVLNGPHVTGGQLNVVGRDFHYHTHYHRVESEANVALPKILETIPNFRDIQIATLGKATKGTGEWIRMFESWGIWLDKQGYLKIMWGSGIPGAGKTILSSIVIKALEEHARASPYPICICYIYFRYSDHASATVQSFLEILVKQTLERHPGCQHLFDEVYTRHIREQTRPDVEELLELLGKFTCGMVIFYVLDALDEAPLKIQLEIVKKLASLNVKLFITSRPMKSIQAAFPDAHCFPITAQDKDLDLHITQELSRNGELQALLHEAEPLLKENIFSSIKEKCGGMFLHAALQLAALRECDSIHEVEEALGAFPTDIEELYLQTWQRIIGQSSARMQRAKKVLLWVLNATRSLTLEELQYAIATCPDTYRHERSRIVSEHALLSVCRGLVTVEEETQLVRLVHYTAKEVLTALIQESFPFPHTPLAAVCMARLAECGFQQSTIASRNAGTISFRRELDETLRSDTFLHYAYNSWSAHGWESCDDPAAAARLGHFIEGCRSFPVQLPGIAGPGIYTLPCFDSLGPLHLAAFFNLPITLAGFSSLQAPNLGTSRDGLTPLQLACMHNSYIAAKELLLLPDVQVNTFNESRRMSALAMALRVDPEGIALLLLSHTNMDINFRDRNGSTCLHLVSSQGNEKGARVLLSDPRIDINLVDGFGNTALTDASGDGHEGIVKLLLARPEIQVTARDLEEAEFGCDYDESPEENQEACRRIVPLLKNFLDRAASDGKQQSQS